MHKVEVNTLRKRAFEFLSESQGALRDNHFNLACFFSDQAVQLYLKSILLELVGDYPRRHGIRLLLTEIQKCKPSKKLEKFIHENRARISSLEDAYIMARYSTKDYYEEDAEDSVKLAEEIIKLVEEVVKQ